MPEYNLELETPRGKITVCKMTAKPIGKERFAEMRSIYRERRGWTLVKAEQVKVS